MLPMLESLTSDQLNSDDIHHIVKSLDRTNEAGHCPKTFNIPKGTKCDAVSSNNQGQEVETNAYQQINQSTENSVCIEMDLLQVGSEPVGMRCPYCQEDMMTLATYRNSTLTHIIALVLGILFWWLCCCFIPYISKRWKNVEHYCPNCSKFLGVYSRKSLI